MPEYFAANVNIGKKGNSVKTISLYACSGSTESTCETTPISGYTDINWVTFNYNSTGVTIDENSSSILGMTIYVSGLTLYKHTHIKAISTSSYFNTCSTSQIIPILNIPTPTPTPTATPIPCSFNATIVYGLPTTPTPTPTATPTCSFNATIVYGLPITPTPTPTATPTVTPTPTPTATSLPKYNVYELCGWTDSNLRYKYILYNVTYGTKGFIDTTTCASQVSISGGILLSEVNSTYPLAMPAGSFETDPISCALCS